MRNYDLVLPSHPSRALTAGVWHRGSAIVLGTFGVAHLLNQLCVLSGHHETVASALRLVYRTPLTEPLLLAAVVVQVLSGVQLYRRGRPSSSRQRWQRNTGLYLAFFLVAHPAAALVQRHVLGGATDAKWAASVVVWPLALWFVPYYTAGITSFTVHLGLATTRKPAAGFLVLGLMVSLLVVGALAGLWGRL